ncbi:hypothetical protein RDABS01_010710, partial [Bienertia sinuspersici]
MVKPLDRCYRRWSVITFVKPITITLLHYETSNITYMTLENSLDIGFFHVPLCIFQCKTLVNLELNVSQRCTFFDFTTVNLQKMKLLYFSFGWGKSFNSITMLIKSCPSLGTLEMTLDSLLNSPCISIIAPNLKSLSLIMLNMIEKHQRSIDFAMDPIKLDSAYIDLTYLSFLRTRGMDANDFVREISKSGLQGNNDEVELVGYILKNAIVLNELLMEVYVDGTVEDEYARVGKEFKFCKACFRLLTSSSTIRVVFSD